jgi:hypothetical protein
MRMKSKHMNQSAEPEQGLFINVARTIGSTLGTLAAKTGSVSKQSARPAPAKKTRSKAGKTRNKRKA